MAGAGALGKKNIIHYGMRVLGRYVIFNAYRAIDDRLTKLQFLSEADLKEEVRNHLDGKSQKEKPKTNFVSQLLSRVFRLFAFRVHQPGTMDAIAVAVEAFRRAPADLPDGSKLYPQQIEAALGLTQPLLIEMDTGEGKTYACLPAAFALLLRYRKVYIICANEYLAWRDAKRTRRYWDYLGVATGLGIKKNWGGEWGHPVVYTTLDNLIFREMQLELGRTRPIDPMVFGALILDEADVILLDQATRAYSLIHPLSTKGFDWGKAIAIAGKLAEPEHVLVVREDFSARLTLVGEKLVQEQLGEAKGTDVLIWYTAVEMSYLGTRLARQDDDYVVEGNRVHPIDRITGRIMRSQRERWMPPLEFSLGLPPKPRNINLHTMTPGWFLNQFPFISGMSGTIQDDAIEYLFAYFLPSIKIEPRHPRHKGLAPDLVFRENAAMFQHLAGEIIARHGEGRPVLVGTQSIADAQNFFTFLEQRLPETADAQLLTGKNEREMADLFQQAGETGAIMVTTQLAGRGVDIRLSEQARRNGGLALYSIGHAKDARYDRQFLGRAGRQGDPFTAQFFCSLDDQIISALIRDRRKAVILQIVGDHPVSSGIVDRALTRAQWDFKLTKFLRRRSGYPYFKLNWEIWNDIRVWFEYSKFPKSGADAPGESAGENHQLSGYFVEWVLDHFLKNHLVIRPVKILTLADAEALASMVQVLLEAPEGLINAADLEGKSPDNALITLKSLLSAKLQAELASCEAAISEWLEVRRIYPEACKKLARLNRHLRGARLSFNPDLVNRAEAKLEAINARANQFTGADPLVRELCDLLGELLKAYPEPPLLKKLKSRELAYLNLKPNSEDERPGDAVISAEWPQKNTPDHDEGAPPENSEGETPPDLRHSKALEGAPPGAGGEVPPWPELTAERRGILMASVSRCYGWLDAKDKGAVTELDRTPNQIAYWSIATNWAAFIEERARIEFRLKKRFSNSDEYFYAVKAEIRRTWQRMEKHISAEVLKNLLRMGHVDQLDALFFLKENKDQTPQARDDQVFEWSPSKPAAKKAEETVNHGERLLAQFLGQDESWLSRLDRFGQAKLRRLITDFNREFPTFVLQSPEKIYRAYEDWFALERERGIPNDERQKHRHWLRAYLKFLSRSHQIGKLPKITNKLKSKFERLGETVKDLKMALVSVLSAVVLLIYFLSLSFGGMTQGPHLNLFFSQMDGFLFGGRISQGNLLAPIVGAQLLLLLVFRSFYKNISEVFVVNKSILIMPLYALVMVWVFDWENPISEPGAFASQVGLFLLSFYLFTLFLKCQMMVQQQSQLSLLSFFVAFQAAGVIWQLVHPAANVVWSWLSIGAALVWLEVFSRFNHYELGVTSSRLKTAESMESESVQTLLTIKASPGVAPHVIAILATGTLFEILQLVKPGLLVGASGTVTGAAWWMTAFYFAVAGPLLLVHANQTFALQNWLNYLSERRLDAGDVGEGGTFHRWLQRCWRQSQLRQLVCYGAISIVLGWGFAGLALPASTFPVLPLLIFACVLLQRYASEFLGQVHAFLMSKVRTQSDLVQLSVNTQAPADESLLDRIKRLMNNKLASAISILIVLAKGALLLKALLSLFFGKNP